MSADAIEAVLLRRPDVVVGLATGSSPVGTFDELGRRVATPTISLARASAFMLDECVGLPAGHHESYRSVIQRNPRGQDRRALSAGWSGSALQLHPDVTVIVGTAAGSRLQPADCYR